MSPLPVVSRTKRTNRCRLVASLRSALGVHKGASFDMPHPDQEWRDCSGSTCVVRPARQPVGPPEESSVQRCDDPLAFEGSTEISPELCGKPQHCVRPELV